ncbi:MAG: hypothetical protein C4323_09810 [Mastigocladus sp. ERB_26_2]
MWGWGAMGNSRPPLPVEYNWRIGIRPLKKKLTNNQPPTTNHQPLTNQEFCINRKYHSFNLYISIFLNK